MKAIVLRRNSNAETPLVELKEVGIPIVPPGSVLVKVIASAIQPSDLINARGGFPYTTFPRIPGRDFAGYIATGPRCGEQIYGSSGYTHGFTCDGFHAEYRVIPESSIVTKPTNISFKQAACMGVPFSTARILLSRANVRDVETVLVIGAFGSVGSAVTQLARAQGCSVITAGRSKNADIDTTMDTNLSGLDSITQGRGVNVVIDTTGVPALIEAAINKLAHGGRIAIIAALGDVKLSIDIKDFYRQEKSLIGCNSLSYSMSEIAEQIRSLGADFEIKKLMPPSQGLWTEIGLEQAVEIYKSGSASTGKFVVVFD
ncbi:LADA_0G02718g1_1 [Lachancea dasiensis]|uniref:LADA_0G02718g1_1 n=1 Tax=Lachancea dasiensis TaxID=1072105 RepID=A0A1G4JRB5_9SACH|nr:LADA_0G02718g1_1 [Lachancea dasiensis]